MHRARRADLVVGLFERTVLHRVAGARYRDEGHGHRVIIEGRIAALRAPIRHDDRKPLQRWFAAQARYASLEAEHLLIAAPASPRPQGKTGALVGHLSRAEGRRMINAPKLAVRDPGG